VTGTPPNNALQLTIALAPAPRDTEEGHSACSPFGEHRALAAERGCSADLVPRLVLPERDHAWLT